MFGLLVLLGCSSSPRAPQAQISAGTDVDDTTVADSSPFGRFFDDDGSVEAAIAAWEHRVQVQTELCMREQGFEFTAPANVELSSTTSLKNLTQGQWNERYGYGISTTATEALAIAWRQDPNDVYLENLTNAEHDAWLTALLGEPPADGVDAPERFEDQGCTGQGYLRTVESSDAANSLQGFDDAYRDRMATIYASEEMVSAGADWSRRMSESGYGFTSQVDIAIYLQTRVGEQALALQNAVFALSPDEQRQVVDGLDVLVQRVPNFDPNPLFELQEEEIAIALADSACYESHVRAVFQPLRDKIQNDLLGEYDDVLSSTLVRSSE